MSTRSYSEIWVDDVLWYQYDHETKRLRVTSVGSWSDLSRPWDEFVQHTIRIVELTGGVVDVRQAADQKPPYDADGRAVAYVPEDQLRRCDPADDIEWTVWDDMLYQDGQFVGVVESLAYTTVDEQPFIAIHVQNPLELQEE